MGSVDDVFVTAAERMKRRRKMPDPLRIGEGATVPRTYVQSQGRIAFFNALYRLKPKSTHDLAGNEAMRLMDRSNNATVAAEKLFNWDDLENIDFEAYANMPRTPEEETAGAAVDTFIRWWQAEYNLQDEWVQNYVSATMGAAYAAWRSGQNVYDAPLHYDPDWGGPDVYDGLRAAEPIDLSTLRLVWHPEHTLKRVPIYLHDLEIPTHVVLDDAGMEIGEYEDDGDIGWFDRRMETVEVAADRIINEAIRPRLIGALNGKVRDDLEFNEAILPPKPMKTPSAYEWTVRYQVLGESRNKIAASVERDRTHVGREIDRVADLVGLTLRPERGGRPAKSE